MKTMLDASEQPVLPERSLLAVKKTISLYIVSKR
jgi:hypothetical protein